MRRRRIICHALVIAALAAGASAGDNKSFLDGCRARDQKNWQQVIAKMTEAISENGKEGGKVRAAGMYVEGYYPHYYLGLGYFNIHNYAAAAAELAESERQGAIKSDAELYASLRRMQASTGPPPSVQEAVKVPKKEDKKAEEKPAPEAPKSGPDPAVVARSADRARSEIAKSEELQKHIVQMKDSQMFAPVWQREAALQTSYAGIVQTLDSARTRLQNGTANSEVKELDAATETAVAVQQELGKLQSTLIERKTAYDRDQIAKVQQEKEAAEKIAADLSRKKHEEEERLAKEKADFGRQEAARLLDLRVRSARTTLAMLEKAGPDAKLTRAKTEINALIQKASAIPPTVTIAELQALGGRLSETLSGANELLARAAAAAGGPPPVLVDAAVSFFGGDYQRTVSLLEKASFSEPRATAQALLLRAAARYALFMVSGGKDGTLRARAAADVIECHRYPQVTLPQSAFSPAFAAFFRKKG
jgi:hypothetical protein